jgi:hypothetical protein
MVQVIEHLPGKYRTLDQTLVPPKIKQIKITTTKKKGWDRSSGGRMLA